MEMLPGVHASQLPCQFNLVGYGYRQEDRRQFGPEDGHLTQQRLVALHN